MAFDVRSVSTTSGIDDEFTVTVPVGTISTDGLCLFVSHPQNIIISIPPNVGWTLLASSFAGDSTCRLLQFSGNPTTGPWTFGLSAVVAFNAVAVAITRDGAVGATVPTPDGTATKVQAATTGAAVPAVVTPTTTGDEVLYAVVWGGGTTFTPPGTTPTVTERADVKSGNTASDVSLWVGSQTNATTAGVATTAISVTNDNPNALTASEYSMITVALKSAPPPSTWVGDLETGDFSQYAFVQGATGAVTIKSDTPRQGTFYAELTARDEDVFPVTPTGDPRASLVGPRVVFAGFERWFSWSTFFPVDMKPIPYDGWLVFWQIHGPPYVSSPVMALGVEPDDRITFQRSYDYGFDTPWAGPLIRGAWQDYVLHVFFATDETGYVELWVNGRQQVFKNGRRRLYMITFEPTWFNGAEPSALLYRKKGILPTVTIKHDAMRMDSSPPALLSTADLQTAPPSMIFGSVRHKVVG